MIHRIVALFLVAIIARMLAGPLVSAEELLGDCLDEVQAWVDCPGVTCQDCLDVEPYDPGATFDCADFGNVCSTYTCCDECAQKGAKAINCVIQETGVCSTTVCLENGTLVSGAVTNTVGVLAMLSIVLLYYVT